MHSGRAVPHGLHVGSEWCWRKSLVRRGRESHTEGTAGTAALQLCLETLQLGLGWGRL